MHKPEKRWQLLLVADDGRIIPFKRIRGLAIGLVALLAMVSLLCVGLGWQLTSEKVRLARMRDQLADARRQATQLKHEHELIAADLVLAEARLEKAGLPVPRHEAAEPAADIQDVGETTTGVQPAVPAISSPPDATAPAAVPAPPVEPAADTMPVSEKAPTPPEKPALAIESPSLQVDTQHQLLLARLRVKNAGPSSSSVEGRCVVVLKNAQTDPQTWISLPPVPLDGGRPTGSVGQEFKLAQFVDLTLQAPAPKDPSPYSVAMVYVFDGQGAVVIEESFPVSLPAPPAEPPPAPQASVPEEAAAPKSGPPPIALSDLTVTYNAPGQRFLARLRIRNTGSRKSPVAGTCVVVLENERVSPSRWLTLPEVPLVEGKPEGKGGREFKISRYVEMELSRKGPKTHPGFQRATVYVFDNDGGMVMEQTFPIDLPATAKAASAPKRASAPAVAAPANRSSGGGESTTPPRGGADAEREDARNR